MYELVKLTAPVSGKLVRAVTDHLDNNFYVANDVAAALGYVNIEKAISDHCKKPVTLSDLQIDHNVDYHDVRPNANMITDADMNRLIFASRLSTAELYKDWVFEDVLPSLRKKGEYTKDDMRVAQTAMQAVQVSQASGVTSDFATEIASLREQLALAQQEAQTQAQLAQAAQEAKATAERALGHTVFEITLMRNQNKAKLTDWRLRFTPLLCAYDGVPDKWGTKYTPKDAVNALAPYAEAAQQMIALALQVKPALYHALSQSGLSREEAIKVVATFSSYVKKEGEA